MLKTVSGRTLLFLYGLLMVLAFTFYPKWQQQRTEATLSWDVSGYYFYLPAIFIYKDLKHLAFKDSVMAKYYPTPDFQQGYLHETTGNYVLKYSSGLAVLMLPGFLAGHFWATISPTYPADGFSYPYQVAVSVWMLFYGFLGLYYLRKVLKLYFSDGVVTITLLVFILGTNLLNFTIVEQAQTHLPLFALYALLLWITIKFYGNPTRRNATLIGFLCGLATLIRPTEIISLGIPLLWGLQLNARGLKAHFLFLKDNFLKLLPAIIIFTAIVAIQPLYWHFVAGEWVVYSYGDQEFNFIRPHVKSYTLSYEAGWIRYSPMLVLPFFGFVFLYSRKKVFWPVFLVSMLAFYIVSAWNVWNYGGNSGRAMIQYYPLLAFPFAALIAGFRGHKMASILLYAIIIGCFYLNIWYTYHAHYGDTTISGATQQYYEAVVGRWNSNPETKKLLDTKNVYTGTPTSARVLLQDNFESDVTALARKTENKAYLELNNDYQWTAQYGFHNTAPNYPWLRAEANFYTPQKEWNLYKMPQLVVKTYWKGEELQSEMIRVSRFLDDGARERIHLDIRLPAQWDSGNVQVWNAGSDKIVQVSDLKVETFRD